MIPCSECDTPFQPRDPRHLTCTKTCSRQRNNRLTLARFKLRHARDEAAEQQAKMADPSYAVEIDRHQKQLRRVWSENGLPLDSLLNWPVYHGGFSASAAVTILGGTPR